MNKHRRDLKKTKEVAEVKPAATPKKSRPIKKETKGE